MKRLTIALFLLLLSNLGKAENIDKSATLDNQGLITECLSVLKNAEHPPLNELVVQVGWNDAIKQKEEQVSSCYRKVKAEVNEQNFHILVTKELRNTRFWLESADWLNKNGYYLGVIKEICDSIPLTTPLHLQMPIYPRNAQMRGWEGRFEIHSIYDKNGYFQKIDGWSSQQSEIKQLLYDVAEFSVKNSRFCPADKDRQANIPFAFILHD